MWHRTGMGHIAGDEIVIVTGASRGIGRAVAERAGRDGRVVAVHHGRATEAAEAVVEGIRRDGGRAFAFRADLAAPDVGDAFWQCYDAAAGAAGFGGRRPYGLVNNAGITLRGTIEELSREDFDRQHLVNVVAPYFVTARGLERLRDGGRIVNVSSGATRIALPDILGYALTKGAVDAFTRTLAAHVGHRGITVNAVAPGVVDTDINASWLRGDQAAADAVAATTALGRVGVPDDIAGIVAFLLSDDARWVTGQTVDGTGGTAL